MVDVGELSVRRHPQGGAVADEVRVLGTVQPRGRRKIVLLIHGYNNDQQAAADSYDKYIANLRTCTGLASTSLPSPIFKFYWPGDTRIRWFSKLSYPWEITPAIESGSRLGDFLADLAGPEGTPVEVHLVAHSLGNRVMLEMLKHLLPALPSSVIFGCAVLMAAAVPVRKVQDPSDLLLPALVPQRRQVLYSSSDKTLYRWFPIGETLAGEGFFPEAVGLHGKPSEDVWTVRRPMDGYDHTDYWPSYTTASVLAELLGAAVATVPVENVIPARQATEDRTLISAAPPREHRLQARPSPGSR